MSNLNVSPAMNAAVTAVLQNPTITEFTIDIQITNADDSTYNFVPQWLDKITIDSNYADAFADEITLEFTAAPDDYMQMFANAKGLQVALRFVFVDSQTDQRVFTPAPIAQTYKAMLMDPKDLTKQYTTGSLKPTNQMPEVEQHLSTRIPVKLSLIEAGAYQLLQQQYHGIHSKVKIQDVIHLICQSFSVKQLYLVPPDNVMQFDHITVPPAQGMDTVFDYLHTQYGVYMKGTDWYYFNNVLYVYPAYENNPAIKYNADVFNAASGNYAGLHSYHSLSPSSNGIQIVSTTDVKTTDLSTPAAEIAGNNYTFMRASSVMDKYRTVVPGKGNFINANNSLTIGSPTDRTIASKANNPKYTKTTDNIFLESSKIAKMDATKVETGWKSAIPYQLYPGHNVKYHFDKDGTFTFQQGLLEKVTYQFSRKRKIGTGNVYSGDAHLTLRANSDVTNATESLLSF